jgi:hypothetical protein
MKAFGLAVLALYTIYYIIIIIYYDILYIMIMIYYDILPYIMIYYDVSDLAILVDTTERISNRDCVDFVFMLSKSVEYFHGLVCYSDSFLFKYVFAALLSLTAADPGVFCWHFQKTRRTCWHRKDLVGSKA